MSCSSRKFVFCILTWAFLVPLLLGGEVRAADNWPEFRGPSANGQSTATGLPTTWSETENIRWKTPIHGRGWSSPVVWGKQIWLTTATEDGKQLYGVCVDAESGKIVHDAQVLEVEHPQWINPMNSYASPTPAIEAGRVYLHFGAHGTVCLDTATGKTLWTRTDLPCNHFRGPASSPILYGDLVIVNFDGYDFQYVVALDKRTGSNVWKTDRNIDFGTADGDSKKGYGTPSIIEVDGKPQLVDPSAGATIAYVPSTGEEIWRIRSGGMNTSARPLFAQGLIYVTTGAGGFQLFAAKPDGHGDVTDTHVAWKVTKSVPTRSSQLIVGDQLYMVSDSGVASSLDLKTGKQLWQKRLEGSYSASPLAADGKIYFFSEDGGTTVVEPGPEFKQLAVNKLGDGFMASSAVTGKALIVRSRTNLYRIEK